jgi:hypothetical protein
MNNNSEYIIVILFLILPFIFYYWSKSRVYQEERFTTDKGCYWKGSDDSGVCVCSKFTPSMLNIINEGCTEDCGAKKSEEECIGKDNIIKDKNDRKYWCQKDGKCISKIIDIKHAAANNCKYDNVLESMNPTFLTKKDCERKMDKCNKYNHSKKKCLRQSEYSCGWCTDGDGNGACVEGTPIGPLNNSYKCRPQTGQDKYNWTMGLANQYFM